MAKRGRKPKFTDEQCIEIARARERLIRPMWLAWVRSEIGDATDATIRKAAQKGRDLAAAHEAAPVATPEESAIEAPEEVDLAPPIDSAPVPIDMESELTEHQMQCACVAVMLGTHGISVQQVSDTMRVNSQTRVLDMQNTGISLLRSVIGPEILEAAKTKVAEILGKGTDSGHDEPAE